MKSFLTKHECVSFVQPFCNRGGCTIFVVQFFIYHSAQGEHLASFHHCKEEGREDLR